MSTLTFRVMLTSLGWQKSFLIYTAIDGVLLFVAWFMIAERRKPSQRKPIIWFDKSFFTDPVFWSLGGCFLFTVFGYLSPIFFLPTFTKQKLPYLSPLVSVLPHHLLTSLIDWAYYCSAHRASCHDAQFLCRYWSHTRRLHC